MADGKIYITITDEPLTKPDQPEPAEPAKPEKIVSDENKNSLFNDFVKHQMFNFIESQAKTFMNYTLGNIGNFTGNYQTQRQIQETMSLGSRIGSIGLATMQGAKAGGWVGAIVGAAVSITAQGVELGLQNNSLTIQTKQQNREIAMMRKISGLDGLTNGSRWGQ